MVEDTVVGGSTLRGDTRAAGAAPATATTFGSLTIVSASASFPAEQQRGNRNRRGEKDPDEHD